MNRTIITVVGKDTVGIIAKVCTYMADHQINILDISQTIIQGFFNMMMIIDTSKMTVDYATMTDEITKLGESTGGHTGKIRQRTAQVRVCCFDFQHIFRFCFPAVERHCKCSHAANKC